MLRPDVSADAARTLVERRLGRPVTALSELAGGEIARVFAVTAGGRELVVRLGDRPDGFRADRHAARHYARPGLPVPAVLAIGRHEGWWYAISQRAPGQPVAALPVDAREALVPAVLAALDEVRRVGTAGTSGYGHRGRAFDGRWPSWRAYLLAIADEEQDGFWRDWHRLFGESFLERAVFDRLYARMADLAAGCPEERWLVHGDFHLGNLLAADGQITAVLDWANAMYGDFVYDLVQLCTWWPGHGWDRRFVERCGAAGVDLPGFDDRLLCYRLHRGLDGLRFFALKGDRRVYVELRDDLLRLASA